MPNKTKPHHSGHRQRLRERLLQSQKNSLPDYEILEILLFAAHTRTDVKPLAKNLIKTFGNLPNVLNATQHDLLNINGVNTSAIAHIRVVQEAAERLLQHKIKNETIINNWQNLLNYCHASMGHLQTEQSRILYLNKKNALIADELQTTGTIDQTPIYPRETAKRALQLNATAIILIHNHPSGNTQPSTADINSTQQINAALKPLGITLHDHIIISNQNHFSFKSNGLI